MVERYVREIFSADTRRRVSDTASSAGARLREIAERLDGDPLFENGIIALIIVNAAILGLATSESFMASYGGLASFLDGLILAVFVCEIALRIIARRGEYFRSGWSWFDMIVVAVAFAPRVDGLQVLRAFRIFRLLRLLSIVPKMRRVIGGFFLALPGMAGVIGVLLIIFYVSAVIATTAFGNADLSAAAPGTTPEQLDAVQALFGTLGQSFFTLFQLMTLENWADGIVLPTMEAFPNSVWFFLIYIVITSFAVLNLFIGIIVDAMQDDRDVADAERKAEANARKSLPAPSRADERLERLVAEVQALRREVASLKRPER